MADQTRLRENMTPADVRKPPARRGRSEGLTARAQVELENGDVIDVYSEQTGGADEGGDEKKVEQLNLKVKDSNGNEVFFKVRRSGDAGGRGALAVAGPDRFRSPPADNEDEHPQEADEHLREWAGRPGAEHGWEWTDLTDRSPASPLSAVRPPGRGPRHDGVPVRRGSGPAGAHPGAAGDGGRGRDRRVSALPRQSVAAGGRLGTDERGIRVVQKHDPPDRGLPLRSLAASARGIAPLHARRR